MEGLEGLGIDGCDRLDGLGMEGLGIDGEGVDGDGIDGDGRDGDGMDGDGIDGDGRDGDGIDGDGIDGEDGLGGRCGCGMLTGDEQAATQSSADQTTHFHPATRARAT